MDGSLLSFLHSIFEKTDQLVLQKFCLIVTQVVVEKDQYFKLEIRPAKLECH